MWLAIELWPVVGGVVVGRADGEAGTGVRLVVVGFVADGVVGEADLKGSRLGKVLAG